MKCIRTINNLGISRVSDAIARKAVLAGHATYIPKHVWKKEVRDNG